MTTYLASLNPVQQEAVTYTEGPAMIIAGAGAGKTSVLTYRIVHLLATQQATPEQILALTFTNKAAQEMRQRIEKVVGSAAKQLWLGTFHSLFARILRKEADKLGYTADFSIYDSTDSKSLLKVLIKEMQLDEKIYKPNSVLARISGAKNRLITAQAYHQNPLFQEEDERARKKHLGSLFLHYAQRCLKADAMDFDDLLLCTYHLFTQHPDPLAQYQARFKYLLIDEFQDTNLAQYRIIQALAARHQNICVVGDDAQSIYAFRGADLQNILNFEKDYPTVKLIKLEQNYRSTQHIVNAANAIISHNKKQLKKTIWTTNAIGEPLRLINATTEAEEGRLVAASIFEEKSHSQLANSDFAVLYRTNSQSRVIEEALRKLNLAYRVVGGMSFYQRKEVKDLLAYLRFVVNPNDEEAFRRIINLPKRGIGPISVEKIVLAAADPGRSLWDVVGEVQHGTSSVARAIQPFFTLVQSAREDLTTHHAYTIAHRVATASGLLKELYEDKTVEGLGRYENVQELLNAIKEFTINNEDVSLGAFLQQVALLTNTEEEDLDDRAKVTLTTVHAAKGLEFPYVYIVGMEEGLFPSPMMLGSPEDIEEERRLFYVAVTRAQRKAFLSYADNRNRFGRYQSCEPSRFIQEMDAAYFHPKKRPTHTTASAAYVRQGVPPANLSHKKNLRAYAAADFQPSNLADLQEHMQVVHAHFGIGTILHLDATAQKATVHFVEFGTKTLFLSFAKLTILKAGN